MRHLNKYHEQWIIKQFLFSKGLIKENQITYPDPPDCLVYRSCCSDHIWIEETSVFSGYLKSTKKQRFTGSEFRKESVYQNPENKTEYLRNLIKRVISSIQKKDEKPNYASYNKNWGRGVLLLKIDCPFFNWEGHLIEIGRYDLYAHLNLKNFFSVYIAVYPMYQRPPSLLYRPDTSFLLIWGVEYKSNKIPSGELERMFFESSKRLSQEVRSQLSCVDIGRKE